MNPPYAGLPSPVRLLRDWNLWEHGLDAEDRSKPANQEYKALMLEVIFNAGDMLYHSYCNNEQLTLKGALAGENALSSSRLAALQKAEGGWYEDPSASASEITATQIKRRRRRRSITF